MLSGCLKPASVPPEGYDPEAIDPAIYARKDDPNDPYRSEYARFRARRDRDMADPGTPRPLERYPNRHLASERRALRPIYFDIR